MQSQTAVLVIDVQNGLIRGPEPVYGGAELVARIKDLTDRARDSGTLVVYIQDNDVGPVGEEPWQLHPGLEPRPDDLFVRKPFSDSFYQTSLHHELTARGVRRLIVAGCKTDACVDATSRRAVSLGYDVTLAADGHSTTDNSFMPAQQSIEYYNVVLDGFGSEDGFGNGEHEIVVRPSAEVEL